MSVFGDHTILAVMFAKRITRPIVLPLIGVLGKNCIRSMVIIYGKIFSLVNELKNDGIDVKIKMEKESGFLGIYTSNFNMLGNAKNGLKDILELSYTTAEHHPYWNMLYNASEIINTILGSWNIDFSDDQIKEMVWRSNEIRYNLTKLESDSNKW